MRSVWVLELSRIGEMWTPLRVYPTRAKALAGRLDSNARYRAVRYVPASELRKPRRPRRKL